jgi:DNA polymerase-3 subunit epsilon
MGGPVTGGWHGSALAGFDLETTGPDPETARIVTASVAWRGTPGDGGRDWTVNPGVEIPAEATAVHGITTEFAREFGADPAVAVAEICGRLAQAMAERWPLVIFNAPYDLTVLDRETHRLGLAPFCETFCQNTGCVVDPLVLDKHLDRYRPGKRTLTAACAHYGVRHDGAHASAEDAVAAMRVAWKIGRLYPGIAEMPAAELHELQVRAKAEQSASFQSYLRRQGSAEVVDGAWPLRACEVDR